MLLVIKRTIFKYPKQLLKLTKKIFTILCLNVVFAESPNVALIFTVLILLTELIKSINVSIIHQLDLINMLKS